MEVELVRGVENDENLGTVMWRDPDHLGERARIDPFGCGGGTGRERRVVLVDLVFGVLALELVEERWIWPVEGRSCAHVSRPPTLRPRDTDSRRSSLERTGHLTR